MTVCRHPTWSTATSVMLSCTLERHSRAELAGRLCRYFLAHAALPRNQLSSLSCAKCKINYDRAKYSDLKTTKNSTLSTFEKNREKIMLIVPHFSDRYMKRKYNSFFQPQKSWMMTFISFFVQKNRWTFHFKEFYSLKRTTVTTKIDSLVSSQKRRTVVVPLIKSLLSTHQSLIKR